MNSEKEIAVIPYIAHESGMARMERACKRLWVLIILLVVMLVGTNLGWILYEAQFETVTETTVTQEVTQDTEHGDNRFIGGDSYVEADG